MAAEPRPLAQSLAAGTRARDRAVEAYRQRMEIGQQRAEALALAGRQMEDRFELIFAQQLQATQRVVLAHCERYRTLLERYKVMNDRAEMLDRRKCDRRRDIDRAVAELSRLAVRCDFETNGAVRLHRLSHHDSFFVKCQQLATQHVRKAYFMGSPAAGMAVVEVFRIDNAVLADRFARAGRGFGPDARTEGVFCSVGPAQVERFVCFGHGDPSKAERTALFRRSWYLQGPIPAEVADDLEQNSIRRRALGQPALAVPVACAKSAALQADRPRLSDPDALHKLYPLGLCRTWTPAGAKSPSKGGDVTVDDKRLLLPEYLVLVEYTAEADGAGAAGEDELAVRHQRTALECNQVLDQIEQALIQFWANLHRVLKDEHAAIRRVKEKRLAAAKVQLDVMRNKELNQQQKATAQMKSALQRLAS